MGPLSAARYDKSDTASIVADVGAIDVIELTVARIVDEIGLEGINNRLWHTIVDGMRRQAEVIDQDLVLENIGDIHPVDRGAPAQRSRCKPGR